jgi:hypothetical protein
MAGVKSNVIGGIESNLQIAEPSKTKTTNVSREIGFEG